jgi:branched-chain amino acid transport system substrate-binding protein
MKHVRRCTPGAAFAFAWLAVACGDGGARVGAVLSQSGDLAIYGNEVQRGIELALEEINAAGGYGGAPVELVVRDDQSSPQVAEGVVRELIDEERIEIFIGGVGSDATLALAPIVEENEAVLLSPSAAAPAITDAGKFVFRNYPSAALEAASMADFAREQGLDRVVVFCEDDAWGRGLTRVFRERFEGGRRATLLFELGGGTIPAPLVAQVRNMQPDGVYLVTYAGATREILPLLSESGIDAVIMGTSSIGPQVVEELGAAAEGLVLTRPAFDVASEEDGARKFVLAYRQKYPGSEPDVHSANGYDAMKLLWTAIKDAGSTDAEDVRRSLADIDGYAGAAGPTTFDDKGDVVRQPRLFVVRDGTAMPYEDRVEHGAAS